MGKKRCLRYMFRFWSFRRRRRRCWSPRSQRSGVRTQRERQASWSQEFPQNSRRAFRFQRVARGGKAVDLDCERRGRLIFWTASRSSTQSSMLFCRNVNAMTINCCEGRTADLKSYEATRHSIFHSIGLSACPHFAVSTIYVV